jgi:hypothetical protein
MLEGVEVRATMNPLWLLEKLKEIERALENEERSTIRKMVTEAQQYAIQMQRETPEQMRRDSRVVIHT